MKQLCLTLYPWAIVHCEFPKQAHFIYSWIVIGRLMEINPVGFCWLSALLLIHHISTLGCNFFLSFFWLRLHRYPEGVIISSLGCLGESWLAFHSRSWLVTGQSLAVLPSPLAPSQLWAHLLPGYAGRLGNQSLSSPCGSDSFVPAGAVVSVPHKLSLQYPGRRLHLSVRWNRSKRILMGCVFRRF